MRIIDNYKELGAKGFIEKWKQGIQSVTPLQQLKAQLPSFLLIFLGVLFGIIVSIKNHSWWLLIILIGALGINLMSFLSTYQRYLTLKNVQDELDNINNENGGTTNAS